MQHGEEADVRTQMFRIAGNGEEGFGDGAEQDLINGLFVIEGDCRNLFRQRKDHMEVRYGQQFGSALLQPVRAGQPLTFGAMPLAARAIDDTRVLAVVAPFDSTAQSGGTAVLDGPHQAQLMPGQGMRLPVRGTVLSKDVGQLQGWLGQVGPLGCGLGLGFGLAAEALAGLHLIQRTLGLGDELRRNGGVAGSSVDAAVAQQHLDDANVGAVL
jgi:hypothetical protein